MAPPELTPQTVPSAPAPMSVNPPGVPTPGYSREAARDGGPGSARDVSGVAVDVARGINAPDGAVSADPDVRQPAGDAHPRVRIVVGVVVDLIARIDAPHGRP